MKHTLTIAAIAILFAGIATTQPAHALEINGSVDLNSNTNANINSNTSVRANTTSAKSNSNTSATTTVKITSSGLVQKINRLTRLTETERSVLTANLKADTQMRLLGPEIAILATIERVDNLIDSLRDLYVKLNAQASTTTNTAISARLTSMNTRLASADAQITAAQNAALTLRPDQGNNSIHQTNLATLRDARDKVKSAMQDIRDARRDALEIWSTLKGTGSVSATTTLRARVQ